MTYEEEQEALATPEYWNGRYSQADGEKPTHEWFKTYDALKPFLTRHLFEPRRPEDNPSILHLGSGDSTIPSDLASRGYKRQTCVDFSDVVVALMSKRDATKDIDWLRLDVRDMVAIGSATVDVAFDKGTMDAMIHGSPWDPPDDVLENTARYMDEVRRVLKPDGVFLYITFRQPHFVKPLLNRDGGWDLEMENLAEDASSFDYFGFRLTKKRV
ncbi:Queuine tRNA-ribosyltransferase-like protein [Sphaceloma murrayae]|uniref:Queuine tRNA-ribosyltransferase-like protein n=1 Tax=Sphaceloma murrayae TaxID=2082308 RepID=A0A2K1QHZ7_9PEZI|nr:Queuine tRNA-ribosyltransferase-like protein [Sphaceloma murrayae]